MISIVYRWFIKSFVVAALLIYGSSRFANAYIPSNHVVSSYSNCKFVDHKNGTSTISATFSYEQTTNPAFISRAVVLYGFDAKGNIMPHVGVNVKFDGVEATNYPNMPEYTFYYNTVSPVWKRKSAINVKVSVDYLNSSIFGGPEVVAFEGGNYLTRGQEIHTSGPYFIPGYEEKNRCVVFMLPGMNYVPDININVTTPDWDLGEINSGEQSISLASTANQLCLKYTDSAVGNKAFIITASNQNGIVNNRYELKNLSDPAQHIPYQLRLDNGNSQLSLPNSGLASLPLRSGGKTCFVPTFKTFAPLGIKAGDYSDVLTFKIVTKS